MRFYIQTLGCRVNQAESDSIASQLMAQGNINSKACDADVIIVNSCTVTGEAEHKNRKTIRSLLKKKNPDVFILTGCAVNVAQKEYEALDTRIICEQNKENVANLACSLYAQKKETISNKQKLSQDTKEISNHFRKNLKVQDGCNNACTYCIVHIARGPAKSVVPEKVLQQAQELIGKGVQEIVLTGIDLGAYNKPSLASLIKTLLTQTNVPRIRLSSIEPESIDAELIELLAQSDGRLCRYLHIPLQSGSDKVLKEMGRKYNAQEYLNLIHKLKTACPFIAISTDVIVGFPGETEEDFIETCTLIKQAEFMKLHIFRYSKRKQTPAALRKDQIDPRIKAERAKKLELLGKELAHQDLVHRRGSKELIVIENIKDGICTGTSESFHTIKVPSLYKPGTLVELNL